MLHHPVLVLGFYIVLALIARLLGDLCGRVFLYFTTEKSVSIPAVLLTDDELAHLLNMFPDGFPYTLGYEKTNSWRRFRDDANLWLYSLLPDKAHAALEEALGRKVKYVGNYRLFKYIPRIPVGRSKLVEFGMAHITDHGKAIHPEFYEEHTLPLIRKRD